MTSLLPVRCLHELAMAALMALTLALSGPAGAREITDLHGYTSSIPEQVSRVYGADPPSNVALHMIAPEVMLGMSFPIAAPARRFYPASMQQLPVLGGLFGSGQLTNAETVLALKPDVALVWKTPAGDLTGKQESFRRLGVPMLFVSYDTLADWPALLRFVGKVVGREATAEPKAVYVEQVLARLAGSVGRVPETQRPRVYYAEGADGLATDCHRSMHAEAIELAAGYNVHRCQAKDRKGMERVSIEQLLAYDPDIIIVQDRLALPVILHDARWRNLRAVKHGRVHVVPQWPYNWIDRPPSATRALGAQWLASLFYPATFRFKLAHEVRRFYQLFFDLTLSDADLDEIMAN